MKLKEVMTRDVDGVRPDAALIEALEKLKRRDGEPLPVYDDGRLVGILTDHDIVEWEARGRRDPRTTLVREVMRRDVTVGDEEQDVGEALRLMRERHTPGLVVVKRNGHTVPRPVGTVSLADLAAGVGSGSSVAPPARVFLQPIAPPSILGLYGFAGATLIVAAHQAGWYGDTRSALFLFPFAAFFGGLAQFMAGMWSYRARDGLATAMHGMWGAFWMGYGVLNLLFATGTLTEPSGAFPELGYWFVALAAITWVGTVAALAENGVLTAVLGFLAAGSTATAYAMLTGNARWESIGGWLFVISAIVAWYLASAMMLEGTWKRVVLPLGKYRGAANTPGSVLTAPIQYEHGQPGVKVGQ